MWRVFITNFYVMFKKLLVTSILVFSFVFASTAFADTRSDLQTQIDAILAQIKQLQAQLNTAKGISSGATSVTTPVVTPVSTSSFCRNWERSLRVGDQNDDVTNLTFALVSEGFLNAKSNVFDETVASAVVGFQEKYASEILTPNALVRGTGFVGVSTRKKLNSLYGCKQTTLPFLLTGSTVSSAFVGTEVKLYTSGLPIAKNSPQYFVEFSDTKDTSATVDSNGTFTFKVPNIPSGNYNIRVSVYGADPNIYNVLGGRVLSSNSLSFSIISITTPQPSITVISPNGGEVWTKGTMQTIKWQDNTATCTGATCPANVSGVYDLKLAQYYPPCIAGSPCPAYPYRVPYVIANGVNLSYSWYVGKIVSTYGSGEVAPDGTYTVQVCQSGTNVCDSSNSYFTITAPTSTTQPSITVISPNGGETWQKGTTQTIKWQDNTPPSSCSPNTICSQLVSKPLYSIRLAPYYPPCTTQICPAYAYREPYTIVKGTYDSYYSWSVGQVIPAASTPEGSMNNTAPDGAYTIQVCQSGTSTCDSSDSYFTVTTPTPAPTTQTVTLNPSSDNFFQVTSGTFTVGQLTSAGFLTSPSPGNRIQEVLVLATNTHPLPFDSASATYYQMNYQSAGNNFYKVGGGTAPYPNDAVSTYFMIRNSSTAAQTLTLPLNLKFFGSTVQNPTTRPWDSASL